MERVLQAIHIGEVVADFLLNTNRVLNAIEVCKECLILLSNKALEKEKELVRMCYIGVYFTMFDGYAHGNDYTSAIECGRKLLVLLRECNRRNKEGMVTLKLAELYQRQNKYKDAKDLYKKALSIVIETGERQVEGVCYGNLGTVCQSLSEYGKAKECYEKALKIMEETRNEKGKANCYGNLGTVFTSLSDYAKAKEYHEKALLIKEQIGDKNGAATSYGNLATVFQFLGDYVKAEENLQNALAIKKEVGDKEGEAAAYGNLGTVFYHTGQYVKAEENLGKALVIGREIGDKNGEAANYGNLGSVCQSLGDYTKAKEYYEKALTIRQQIGAKNGEAVDYANLGTVFCNTGEYAKAEEYIQRALAIRKEIGGDKKGEAGDYANLGSVFRSLGDYTKAKEYNEKALAIRNQIGDRNGVAESYANLGTVCQERNDYTKAKEYHQKALAINKEICNKNGEATDCGNLGSVFLSLGDYAKAKEYHENALVIRKEISDKGGEASSYGNLGTVFLSAGEYVKAKEYYERALLMGRELGDVELQFSSYLNLTWVALLLDGNVHEAVLNLSESIQKSEEMRSFLRDNEQFKIAFLDRHMPPYHLLTVLFSLIRSPDEALSVVELGRARALADIMSNQYSVEKQESFNPQLRIDVEKILKKESNCACLYISYYNEDLFLWIIKPNKTIRFRIIDNNICYSDKEVERSVEGVFDEETFRTVYDVPLERCEDRSLFPSNAIHLTRESSKEGSLSASRLVEEDEDENQHPEPPTLAQCYKMIIAPVADLLEEHEIIIVPDRLLYKVPFAALKDENGNYLSEKFKIRIVPSLTTLKLIQNSPADYHSQTGALIVGEPDVSQVYYKGSVEKLCPLPCARKEAEMIGRLLESPLLGEQATKQAVLESLHSVSLIHIAAHGNAERGEIALAPSRRTYSIPKEQDYLLTMAEISQVRLRAKLVVLSCCHSARGQIGSEGVVGVARAFLGSGARSVLVSLWALQDEATEKFMSRFYEHLVHGKSASESLHEAMKWMRGNGYSDVGQWAPFMLIGDNVTFDFGK